MELWHTRLTVDARPRHQPWGKGHDAVERHITHTMRILASPPAHSSGVGERQDIAETRRADGVESSQDENCTPQSHMRLQTSSVQTLLGLQALRTGSPSCRGAPVVSRRLAGPQTDPPSWNCMGPLLGIIT